MKKLVLTTAVALLAGTALAAAQGNMNGNAGNHAQGAAPAPAAQQRAPAEKIAPTAQHQNAAQTTGQAAPHDTPMTKGAHDKSGPHTTGQASKSNAPSGIETPKANNDSKANTAQKHDDHGDKGDNKASMDSKSKSSMDSKIDHKNGKAAQSDTKSNTTGQGAAGTRGKADLSSEQRTKIRTVIKDKVHAQPLTHVNFSINVGTVVPRSVHFYPVPAEVVTIYPEWRGYNFILVNNQIIIIDPATYTIVEIIA